MLERALCVCVCVGCWVGGWLVYVAELELATYCYFCTSFFCGLIFENVISCVILLR